MTDNEIIKDFEKLTKYSGFTKKVEKLLHDVIDLIKHQKAEIERLKAEIVIRDKIIDERGKEVFRHDNAIRSLHKQFDNLKSQAIKEFAERLCNSSIVIENPLGQKYRVVTTLAIDNLVKEMTEVETNQRKEDEKNGVHI